MKEKLIPRAKRFR